MVPAGVGRVGGPPSTSCATCDSENPATGTLPGSNDAVTRSNSLLPLSALRMLLFLRPPRSPFETNREPRFLETQEIERSFRQVFCALSMLHTRCVLRTSGFGRSGR